MSDDPDVELAIDLAGVEDPVRREAEDAEADAGAALRRSLTMSEALDLAIAQRRRVTVHVPGRDLAGRALAITDEILAVRISGGSVAVVPLEGPRAITIGGVDEEPDAGAAVVEAELVSLRAYLLARELDGRAIDVYAGALGRTWHGSVAAVGETYVVVHGGDDREHLVDLAAIDALVSRSVRPA